MSRKTNVMVASSLKTIAIMTLLSSAVWTGVAIYEAFKTPADLNINPEILEAVDPTIDMEALKGLNNRRQLTEEVSSKEIVEQAMSILQTQSTENGEESETE